MPNQNRTRTKPPHYLKEWRKFRGLTQTQVSGRVGVNESNISRHENYQYKYTQELLEAFSEAYGCEPADLLRPPPTPSKPESEFERYRRTLGEDQKAQAVAVLRAMFERGAA